MSQSQIRLTRTPEIDKVLSYLQNKYNLLSESEIIKVALSEKYYKEMLDPQEKERQFRKMYEELKIEGGNSVIDSLRKRG